jgi:tetratricopeptide (TPR) repeat protein
MGKASRLKKRNPTPRIPRVENHADSLQWWLVVAVCLVAFLAFAQTLSYDFVYDDNNQILRNPWIRDWMQVGNFFFENVWSFTGQTAGNYYRPFHMVAHAAGYSISGLNPVGFHLINILLHCANTLLLTFIGYRLTRNKFASIGGGLLFALHPIHVESVAWIAGVTDPLCAIFYLGALYVYLNDAPTISWKTGLWTSILFLGALFSKEMAFSLPMVILWLDFCLGRKMQWRHYSMLAITFALYSAFRINALSQFQVHQIPIDLSFFNKILSLVMLLGQYLAKAFIPFDINTYHVFYPITSIRDGLFLLSSAAIAALAFIAWKVRREKAILFLCGFLPLALFPVLNIRGIGANIFADRYLYIPSLGSCLLIPLLIQQAGKWKSLRLQTPRLNIAAGLLGILSLFYIFMLWKTTFVWRDNFTLYTQTLKSSPDSPAMAARLAEIYYDKGENQKAGYWLSRAQSNHEKSFIKDVDALCVNLVRLSSIYLQEGRMEDASECLERAYKENPKDPGVLQNLGVVAILKKDYVKARSYCEASLAINPRNEISNNNLAFISLQENQIDKAIEYALKALEIFPRYSDAHLNLARGYAAKGLMEQASESYRNAAFYNPLVKSAVDRELKALQAAGKSR